MATTRRACEIHVAVGGSGTEHEFQTSVRSPHIGWKSHLPSIDEALVSSAAQTGDQGSDVRVASDVEPEILELYASDTGDASVRVPNPRFVTRTLACPGSRAYGSRVS